jgi:hypothetical protein
MKVFGRDIIQMIRIWWPVLAHWHLRLDTGLITYVHRQRYAHNDSIKVE